VDPDEELPRLLNAIDEEDSEEVRIFFRLALLTGARKSELVSTPWKNVYEESGVLRLPERKNKREFTLHLPSEAVELIKRLPSRGESKWLFPSPRLDNDHRRDFRTQWRRIRERADLEDVTFHDLRRTAGVLMARKGVPLQVISDVLGHLSEDVTRVYARILEDHQREALEAVSDALSKASGDEEDDSEKETAREILSAIKQSEEDPQAIMSELADLIA
jgi:integrase